MEKRKMDNVSIALLLTLAAGLFTGVGSAVALFAKKTDVKFLSFSLGLSAGVMIYVSMMEMLIKSISLLSSAAGEKTGLLWAISAFFGGILLMYVIGKFIPEGNFPTKKKGSGAGCGLLRTGAVTAIAIAVHNFPEGMATFVSSLSSPAAAIPIVFAIAVHNIPEGVAVSVPVLFATGSRKRAFLYSLLSGLTEPLGALCAYLVLMPIMSDITYGIVFGIIAGIMTFISFDELIPSAEKSGGHSFTISGLFCGMAIMALSLWLFV